MLLVFWIIFSLSEISQIESIEGGRAGGEWGRRGQVGSRRWAKATIWIQAAVLCLQYGTRTTTIHRVGQDCRQEQLGTPNSPINASQGQEMYNRGLTALVKSRL